MEREINERTVEKGVVSMALLGRQGLGCLWKIYPNPTASHTSNVNPLVFTTSGNPLCMLSPQKCAHFSTATGLETASMAFISPIVDKEVNGNKQPQKTGGGRGGWRAQGCPGPDWFTSRGPVRLFARLTPYYDQPGPLSTTHVDNLPYQRTSYPKWSRRPRGTGRPGPSTIGRLSPIPGRLMDKYWHPLHPSPKGLSTWLHARLLK